MGYEIDYLPVGNSESKQLGDAIAMRFWNPERTEQLVITIDGGTLESGAAVVKHVKEFYETDTVDIAILTHPEADHASGLREIIKGLNVKRIFALVPWNHAEEIIDRVKQADARCTVTSLKATLREAYPCFAEVEDLATERAIPIYEKFGSSTRYDLGVGTNICFLGPTREEYINKWLPEFSSLPQAGTAAVMAPVVKAVSQAFRWIVETWDKELLLDPGPNEVSSVNNSSLIFTLEHEDRRFLFCGDAGVPAIQNAIDLGIGLGIPANGYNFFDVPHHGSRRNLGPTILNQLMGVPRTAANPPSEGSAFISAPPNDPKHPSKRITNALNRRARTVICTLGSPKCHHSDDYNPRNGWSPATPTPYFDEVEEFD
ncbi:MAG: hypothetical protein H7A35_13260 [Planctomycetales bacterium]|nr:MAG: hypothetical protein H7A35_13260 [Planctomycetales bacterium]